MAGLYLHIPFCDHKCGYCDFYSATNLAAFGEAFVAALIQEIEQLSNKHADLTFNTIFFGGGTPSLLSESQLDKIMHALFSNYRITENAEVTLETNPGTVNKAKLASFKKSGINRISFGVQSFHDDELRFMERIHSSKEARDNIAAAKAVGFENVSFDLIFALPNQTLARWQETLETAVALETPHISAYSLIFEKNTPFYTKKQQGLICPLEEEQERQFFEFTMNFLAQHNYKQYEVSNYSRSKNTQSQHNLKYWHHKPYVGFGPSAHSYDGTNKRHWNIRSTEKYIDYIQSKKNIITGTELLTDDELKSEYIMLGLRLNEGISLKRYQTKFSSDFIKDYAQTIEKFTTMGMISVTNNYCSLSKEGIFYCDEIIAQF
jgi:oxygen-independent coproporphyrinogen-3 oxidase